MYNNRPIRIEIEYQTLDVEKFMKSLSESSLSPYAHAVFAKNTTKENLRDGQMDISQSKRYNDKLRLETIPWTAPDLLTKLENLPEEIIDKIDMGNDLLHIYPEELPNYIEKHNPRRIIVNGIPVLKDVSFYINDEYIFRGFEVGIEEDERIKIFASRYDSVAGIKNHRNNKNVVKLFFKALGESFEMVG